MFKNYKTGAYSERYPRCCSYWIKFIWICLQHDLHITQRKQHNFGGSQTISAPLSSQNQKQHRQTCIDRDPKSWFYSFRNLT